MTAPAPAEPSRRRRRRLPRLPPPWNRIVKVLIILLIVEYLVLPQLAGARKSLDTLGKVNVLYLLAGVGFEAAAVAAYAGLTRAVLPREQAPTMLTLLRIELSTLSVSHVVPGGTAAGTSLGYRLLTEKGGVDGTDAGFALATQGLGSAVVLNGLLWIALVVSIPLSGFNAVYLTAALVGALLIGAFALLILALTRGEERAARLLRTIACKVPILDENAVDRTVHRLADRVDQLGNDRPLLYRAVGWAAANWLLDAASLWVFVAAFGHRVSLDGLMVSFGLAYVLAAIPLTPGGLGVVETVLTSSLVGFGAPRSAAILGVISYRLVNFWLPIPLGGVAYLSLEVGAKAPRDARRRELRRLAETVVRPENPPA